MLVFSGFGMQMLFSKEHLSGWYIQLRSFCEEKKVTLFHITYWDKKIKQEYEKKEKKMPMFAQKGLIRGLRGGALLGGVMAMSR